MDRGYIQFLTHAVYITILENERISCFKVAGDEEHVKCDFEVFDTEEEATEYILEPFNSVEYRVVLDE